jgi:hypothetical protein
MPSRGPSPDQPGGWLYNALPYTEYGDLRKAGISQVIVVVVQSQANLMQVVFALRQIRHFPQFLNCGNQKGNEYADNGKDNKHLHQGERHERSC